MRNFKPGFHMIATIALIAAIAEKKRSAIAAIIRKPLSIVLEQFVYFAPDVWRKDKQKWIYQIEPAMRCGSRFH